MLLALGVATPWGLKQRANAFKLAPAFSFSGDLNGALIEYTTATTVFIARIILDLSFWTGKIHSDLLVVMEKKIPMKGILGQADEVPTVGAFRTIFDIAKKGQQGGRPIFGEKNAGPPVCNI